MKKILMLVVTISLLYSCKATKETNSVTGKTEKSSTELSRVWVLEELNGKKVMLSDFQKELPRIEFNVTSKTFKGYGGCNIVEGNFISEKNQLHFPMVIPMTKYCSQTNKESEFLAALKNLTQYTIVDNKLMLSGNSGHILSFNGL